MDELPIDQVINSGSGVIRVDLLQQAEIHKVTIHIPFGDEAAPSLIGSYVFIHSTENDNPQICGQIESIRSSPIVLQCLAPLEGESVCIDYTVKSQQSEIKLGKDDITVYGKAAEKQSDMVIWIVVVSAGITPFALFLISILFDTYWKNRSSTGNEVSVPTVRVDPAETREDETLNNIPTAAEIFALSPPSYEDSTSIPSDDEVPTYTDFMANSAEFARANPYTFAAVDNRDPGGSNDG